MNRWFPIFVKCERKFYQFSFGVRFIHSICRKTRKKVFSKGVLLVLKHFGLFKKVGGVFKKVGGVFKKVGGVFEKAGEVF